MTAASMPHSAGKACAESIQTALGALRGVSEAELNFTAQTLTLRYDPAVVDMDALQHTADEVAGSLDRCPDSGARFCQACTVHLGLPFGEPERTSDRLTLRFGPASPQMAELTRSLAPAPSPARSDTEDEKDEVRPLLISTVLCGAFLAAAYGSEAWLQAGPWVYIPLYLLSYVTGGYFRVLEGLEALIKEKNLDINFLMILGAAGAAVLGRWEEGAVLMFLFTLSATLEAFAVGRTRQAIRRLMALAPEDALIRRGSVEERIPVTELTPGDLVIVGPGERIPADGQIIKGASSVNEAAITGESIPVEKALGDKLFAGTVNGQGVLEFEVTKRAGESTLARIVRMVEQAQSEKAETQRLTDWIDRYYTLAVIAVATLAWVVPPLAGWDTWESSFYRAMMLLVVASPCALVIATPAAILSAIARAARAGILFKGGLHLEQAARIQVVAFDKTGTLTTGRPGVVEILAEEDVEEEELLRLAAAAESRSEHPLAHAVIRSANERGLSFPLAEEFQAMTGLGARAQVEGREVFVGSPRLLHHHNITPSERVHNRLQGLYESGLTTMVVISAGKLLGILGLADTPRPEAREALRQLKRLGVRHLVMLTGDNRRAAQSVADAVGIDEVRAELFPEDKLRLIKELEERYGPVAMVGDGVNDAPALAAATVGIAMGSVGSDVAMETADIVLMSDELAKIPQAVSLARRARSTILQNLGFAVVVILGLVAAVLSENLSLPLAVVGHEGSTILVAFNGLRLLIARIGAN